MFKEKGLEKLVPLLELCREIPVGKFDDSALMLIFWYKSPNTPVEIRTRCEVENDPEFDDLVEDQRILIYPAPTLQEILEALESHGSVFTRRDDDDGWEVMLEIAGDDEGYGYDAKIERDTANPATAALRLWLEINKKEKDD